MIDPVARRTFSFLSPTLHTSVSALLSALLAIVGLPRLRRRVRRRLIGRPVGRHSVTGSWISRRAVCWWSVVWLSIRLRIPWLHRLLSAIAAAVTAIASVARGLGIWGGGWLPLRRCTWPWLRWPLLYGRRRIPGRPRSAASRVARRIAIVAAAAFQQSSAQRRRHERRKNARVVFRRQIFAAILQQFVEHAAFF